MTIYFQVYSKPEELWFYILLLKIKKFFNFKESHPQFFLICFKIFKKLWEVWIKWKKSNEVGENWTHFQLDRRPLPNPLHYRLIHHVRSVKTCLKWNIFFCMFLRGLTSFILTFFHKLMLNHVPIFSTCQIF